MNIVITGGAGFIGSNLAEYYLNKNHTVYVIDDLSTGCIENIQELQKNPNFHFIKDDILTYSGLENLVEMADYIFHLAAIVGVFRVLKEPERVLNVNIIATNRLLDAVKKSNRNPRVIIASTSEVYGNTPNHSSNEEDDLLIHDSAFTRSSYAISKIAAESYAVSYYKEYNIPITILRFFNIIGRRQMGRYGMVVPRFVKNAIANAPIVVYGTGEQKRCFTNIQDAVVLISQISENKDAIGEIINLGSDNEISINDLAKLVIKLTKSESKIEHISYNEAYGEDFTDFMRRRPDLTKLRQLTKYQYQWDLTKTLNYLIEFYRQ